MNIMDRRLAIFSIYAPKGEKSAVIKYEFFENLQNMIKETTDIILMMINFNTRVESNGDREVLEGI